MKKQLTLAGWCLLRVVPSDAGAGAYEEVYWEPRWVALEGGSLLWYIDEMQVFPEDMVALVEPCVRTQRQLENGEVIMVCKGENVNGESLVVELGTPASETVFWHQAIDLHVDTLFKSGSMVSVADLTMDDVAMGEDASAASSVRISIRGEMFNLVVTSEDNSAEIAKQFVAENGLKKELEGSVERELLKAQVSGCLLRENKLKKQISQIRRRLGDVALAEGRAAHAEQHAASLATSLQAIELMVPQIQSQLDGCRQTILERDNEIKELQRQLQEEDTLIHRLAKESDEIADSMLDQQQEARRTREERDALERELLQLEAELAAAVAGGGGSGTASSPSSPLPGMPPSFSENIINSPSLPGDSTQEVRRANVALTQQLLKRDVEIKRLQLDLKTAMNARNAAAAITRGKLSNLPSQEALSTSSSSLELQYKRKITQLEEKVKLLGGSLKASDEGRSTLQTKLDEALAGIHHTQSQLRSSVEEMKRAKQEIKELRLNANARNYDALMAENRSLRDETISYRGEVLRLQARIDEVQSSAVQAVQSLQLLGPRGGADWGSGGLGQGQSSPTPVKRLSRATKSSSEQNSAQSVGTSPRSAAAAAATGQQASSMGNSSVRKSPTARSPPPPPAATPTFPTRVRLPDKQAIDLSSELQRTAGQESVQFVWEPSLDVASAKISPVVEDRLLHNIYSRYVGESAPHMGTTTLMTLSKFGRFAKDFGISIIAKGGAAQPPFLVNGEIDVIFLNATQIMPDDKDLPERAPRAFGVRAGAGDDRQYKRSTVGPAGAAPVISAGQFVAAVKVLACQLYANVIEHETGTVLECLPPRQREAASRAVMDVLLKKKLVPTAEKLGLVPWPLIYLDQSLTVLTTFAESSESLSRNFPQVVHWFNHYCSLISATPSGVPSGHLTYKLASRFAHDFGLVPYLVKEPQLFRCVGCIFYLKGNVPVGFFYSQHPLLSPSLQPVEGSSALDPQ